MPSSYTTNLRLTLPATGENSGTWGTLLNTGTTSLIDSAIAGTAAVTMTDADYTLTVSNGASDESRCMFVDLSGALTATRNVVCPAVSKLYFVYNGTSGGQPITFKTLTGTGITVPNGKRAILYCNGTNVLLAFDYISGPYTIEANSATTALRVTQTGAGDSFVVEDSTNPDATPFVVTSSGNVGVGVPSPAQKLEVSGNILASGTIGGSNLTSGTWSPTISNTVNIASSTAGTMYYSRVGDVVTFGGPITIQATATGVVELQLSLPVASNFSGNGQVSGSIVATNNGDMVGVIKANPTNDTMEINYTATVTSSRIFNMHGVYRII